MYSSVDVPHPHIPTSVVTFSRHSQEECEASLVMSSLDAWGLLVEEESTCSGLCSL